MAKKRAEKQTFAPAYKVINGCTTADGTRYEVGADYFPGNHTEETTAALLRLKCLEETD